MNTDLIFTSTFLSNQISLGSLSVIPTDTLPAFAISPENAHKIWEVKARPCEKPLILMGARPQELFQEVLPSALEDAWLISEKYWPGALTMVLPASGKIVKALNKKEESIGLRVPACGETLELLDLTGPLATTSVNFSGSNPLRTPEEIIQSFPEIPLLGPTPWPNNSGKASTVISWVGKGKWRLLRRGALIPDITIE